MSEEPPPPDPDPRVTDIRLRGSSLEDIKQLDELLKGQTDQIKTLKEELKQLKDEKQQADQERLQTERSALLKQFTPKDRERYKDYSNRDLKIIMMDRQKPGLEIPPSEERKTPGHPEWDPVQQKNIWKED